MKILAGQFQCQPAIEISRSFVSFVLTATIAGLDVGGEEELRGEYGRGLMFPRDNN